MGVGKTYPTLSALVATPGPRLVIAPSYLIPNWVDAIAKFDPRLTIDLVDGDPQDKLNIIIQSQADIILAGYSILSLTRYSWPMVRRKWGVIAFDEADYLRNQNAAWTKAAFKLKADHIWMLTGTPLVKAGSDIWSMLHICDRKVFSSFWRFAEDYCYVYPGMFTRTVGGIRPEMREEFSKLIGPYTMQRTLDETPHALAAAIVQNIRVDLPKKDIERLKKAKKEQRMIYPDGTEIPIFSAGALVPKLRKFTGGEGWPDGVSPKIDAARKLIADKPGEPVIVWCWYKETASNMASALASSKRPVFVATGDTTPTKRAAHVELWKKSTDGILVATLASLALGANLQHAAIMAFVEESHVERTNVQAVGRARRRGQTRQVRVYDFHCYQTIDEDVHKVAKKRGKSNDAAILREYLSHD